MATRSEVMRLKIEVDGTKAKMEVDRFADKAKTSSDKVNKGSRKMTAGFKAMRIQMLAVTAAVVGRGQASPEHREAPRERTWMDATKPVTVAPEVCTATL